MAAKYKTYTLDEAVVTKMDWIMDNAPHASRSGLLAFLIEREFIRLKKAKLQMEG